MAEKLTPQQAQAVRDRGGRLLVSAAAGSGKTKVLVDRLMLYLTDPVDPACLDDFLIITYTKAAASELRGKIAGKLTERIAEDPENRHLQQQMQRLYLTKISTVHSFCSDLLRNYAYRMDLAADFRVADENECRELRQTVLEQVLNDAYENAMDDPAFRAFVDTQGLGRNDALVPEIVEKVYDSARCHLNPEQWLDRCVRDADVGNVADAGETVWGKYLIHDLFVWLDRQVEAFEACLGDMKAADGFEKPLALISDTVYQLTRLRESRTWDEIHHRRNIDFGRLTFPRKCSDPELADRVKAVRAACKKGLEKRLRSFADPSVRVLGDLKESAGAASGLVWLVREFGKGYDRAKRNRRILDFGDLEHKTLDLLLGKNRTAPTAAALEIGRQFREILVDEYQDSNAVQDAIFSALTEQRQNLFMVGDVKQSIYQFRLADPGIFLEKYEQYVPADEAAAGQGRKVLLSSNFRSGGAVLAAANQVFRECMSPAVGGLHYGETEALREGIPHAPLGEPEVELHVVDVREETYPEEAEYVAHRISTLLDGTHMVRQGEILRPITADDVVILLRSPGSVGAYFQNALARRGIRCTSGGGTDLLQTPEIQTLRSLLQTVSNPRQDIPLIAVLTSPVFGLTADEMAQFRSAHKYSTVYDALLRSELPKCRDFVSVLGELRRCARMNTLAELLEKVFVLTNMDGVYAAMAGGEAKSANLQSFFKLASDFEQVSRRDLSQFLDHLDSLEEKGLPSSGEQTSGAVTIMSIHKSKGLEFPVVFLAGLSREFNRESIRAHVLCDRELGLGLSCADTENRVRYPTISKKAIAVKTVADSVSEELRVLYVAMTRARDRLIMTYGSRNPEGELRDIALRMDMGGRELLTADVVCPGEWVLYAALKRTEAGELHRLGGRPRGTESCDHPWLICVGEAPVVVTEAAGEIGPLRQMPEGAVEELREALAFRYGHEAATQAPSKQTATGRKDRFRDREAAELAEEPKVIHRSWRKPSFRAKKMDGAEFGTAIHAVMQYVRYDQCSNRASVEAELKRMVDMKLLSVEQADAVDPDKIVKLFDFDLGRKLRNGNVLREFKFSILDDGTNYGPGLEGERVLLQGVVDCALIEDDGITIVDFKTDRVSENTVDEVIDRYRSQVTAYADAMARIYEQPIKGVYLYLFQLDRFVEMK